MKDKLYVFTGSKNTLKKLSTKKTNKGKKLKQKIKLFQFISRI